MALGLRINIEANKDSITFFETTCAYDVTSNDTGWGAPNPLTTDAVSAVLNITQPNSDVVTDTIDLFTYYPDDSGLGFKVFQSSLQDIDASGVVQDGLWEFEYVVVVTEGEVEVTYTTSCKFLFTHNIDCCIATRAKSISVRSCDTGYDEETFELLILQQQANNAFCSQEYARAEEIVNYLKIKCDCCCA